MTDIGKFIKDRRVQLGLTQLDVAKAVGVAEATVSRWESGNIPNMKRSRIASLAKVLAVSPSSLVEWDDDVVSNRNKKSPGPDDSEPRDENEREIISYLRRLMPQQQVFLLALLKTVDELNQKSQSSDPPSTGDRAPISEIPIRT